jgi:hypothetical protein
MTSRAEPRRLFVTAFVAMASFGCLSERAAAQWGFGMGFGAWGGFHPVPSPQIYLNEKSLVDASRDTHIPTGRPYANDPNSYINHIRDNGFVEKYNVDRREPAYYRYGSASYPSPGQGPSRTTMTAAQARPVVPLASFYNAQSELVWPSDAPTEGALKEKRTTFDQASLAALTEKKESGVASMAAVTDARNKLLDYGRPALQFVRTHETPRIADTFHLFLLSLYESLAQAATPTAQAGPATPPPAPSS